MGNHLARSEQELSQSLSEEYKIETHPYLLHKKTNQLCILHKITTNSTAEADRINNIIEEYARTKCQSISKLRQHYHLTNNGYCSDEQNFYLIFQGQNNYNLKDQFVKRRYHNQKFFEEEIIQILETYLNGLRQYNHRFQRDYDILALQNIIVNEKNKKMHLVDPWLRKQVNASQGSDHIGNIIMSYPSPQKLKSAYVSKMQQYSLFLSNLFSIGIIGLQINDLEFADGVYSRKKQINYQQINQKIGKFRNEKLRMGISYLLNFQPNQRKKIYQIWGIDHKQSHYLQIPNKNINSQNNAPTREQTFINDLYAPNHDLIATQKRFEPIVQEPKHTFHHRNFQPLNYQTHARPVESIWIKPQRYDPYSSLETQNIHQKRPFHLQTVQQTFEHSQNPKISFKKNSDGLNNNGIITNYYPSQFNYHSGTESYKNNLSFNKDLIKIEPKNQPLKTIEYPKLDLSFKSFVQNSYSFPKISSNNDIQKNTKSLSPIIKNKQMRIDKIPFQQSFTLSSSNQFNLFDNFKKIVESPTKQSVEQNKKYIETISDPLTQTDIKPIQNEYKFQIQDNQANSLRSLIQGQQFVGKGNHYMQNGYIESLTPQRPTAKNKYNSTIVEVHNEDTPQHSEKQDEPVDQQYIVQEYETGSKYEGFKSKGMRNGGGKFYYQDGGYYQGQWKNNKMDGWGRLYYEGGKLAYEGYWAQDQFNGLGKVYNDNPAVLSESFDYTNFDFLEDYWEYYEGMLMKDTKQGRGKIKLSNNEIFEGDFHNDRIQGFGKFYTKNGQIIEGIWRDSKLIKIISG